MEILRTLLSVLVIHLHSYVSCFGPLVFRRFLSSLQNRNALCNRLLVLEGFHQLVELFLIPFQELEGHQSTPASQILLLPGGDKLFGSGKESLQADHVDFASFGVAKSKDFPNRTRHGDNAKSRNLFFAELSSKSFAFRGRMELNTRNALLHQGILLDRKSTEVSTHEMTSFVATHTLSLLFSTFSSSLDSLNGGADQAGGCRSHTKEQNGDDSEEIANSGSDVFWQIGQGSNSQHRASNQDTNGGNFEVVHWHLTFSCNSECLSIHSTICSSAQCLQSRCDRSQQLFFFSHLPHLQLTSRCI
mmetsp:Transcript_21152/g.48830  ORF Transcript_21152/g.48830 Transcript_21152/m.48830 type:complete len:303 (+) Transcript_21152:734-1642(+)